MARALIAQQPLFPENPVQLGYVLYIAVFSTGLAFLFFFNGIRLIGSSDAALVNSTEPLIAYLAGLILMAEVVSLRVFIGGLMILTANIWLNIRERESVSN